MKTEILLNQKTKGMKSEFEKTKEKGILNTILVKNNLLTVPIAFLLGRATIAGGLMPFGMAAYAATIGTNINRMLIAVSIIAGMITNGAGEQMYVAIIAMLLFNVFNMPFKNDRPKVNFRFSVIAFISILIPQMVTAYLQGFLLYDTLKAVLQSFIAFSAVFIFKNACALLEEGRKGAVTNEQMISVAITAALALSGIGNIILFNFNIKNILCILVIMAFSYKCGPGAGAAIGVTVGLLVSMSTKSTPLIIGSYAFCGLLSGVLRSLGRLGSGLGFIMGNTVLTLYMNGSTEVIIYLKEIIASVLVFLLIPHRFLDFVLDRFNKEVPEGYGDKKSYSARIKDITVDKLNKFSMTFKELSKTFSEISETKVATNKQDISSMFDRVADKVCKDCSLCLHCWDRNFYSTYQVMFKIIERLDKKGRIDQEDVPEYFLERCERINEFVKSINNVYEVFKVDMVWKNKIGESRGLVSQQLEGLSSAISNLASEISTDVRFKADIEDMLVYELQKSDIKAKEVIVYENKWGKYEISIFHKGCGGRRICLTSIEKLVSASIGRKMIKDGSDCYQRMKNNLCSLKLVEEESFSVTTGIAKHCKQGGTVSGDNYTFLSTGDGKYVVALSDGMGSGHKAFLQSKATISLLEQFMESGFDKDLTVKLINSILVLKSSEDTFSTIDMTIIDLYEGEAEFVKIGAVPTIIKRENKVESVKSVSLPAGILSNIEVELVHKKLCSGDFIIMASDGVLDSFEDASNNEKEFNKFVEGIGSLNPQEIADIIIAKAIENCNEKPTDDMLVLVSKLWKRT